MALEVRSPRHWAHPVWRLTLAVGLASVMAGAPVGPAVAQERSERPAQTATVSLPNTPAGSQARWFVGAVTHWPISTAEIEAHFDGTYLAKVPPAQLDATVKGVTALQVDSITTSTPDALVFVVTVNGRTKLSVSMAVDSHGLIVGLGLVPVVAAPTTPVPSNGAGKPPTSAGCVKDFGVACYSPKQLQRAYDLAPLYAKGFDGKGRTIVIIDPYGSPTLAKDLATFDHALGLPAPPSLRVLQPVGKVPAFNPANAEMVEKAGETTGDVETAHEIAPGASILVIETPAGETLTGGGFSQFMAADNYVVTHNLGDVMSQSFGIPEQNFKRSVLLSLRYGFVNAEHHDVTALAASNDLGATGPTTTGTFYTDPIVDWPASDPLVTGVGGTTLHLDAAGNRTSPDTAWNDSHDATVKKLEGALPWASSGGLSAIFARPTYQGSVAATVGDHRGVPDVSMSASLSGAVLLYGSYTGTGTWGPGGGTSAACPEFAGIVAIADQYAGRRLGLINSALYRLETEKAPGIVDVTQGNNTVSFLQADRTVTVKGYSAKPGYDLVTGVGTINAALFVPELAAQR